MAITRTTFKNAFRSNNLPDWVCPSCKTGLIKGNTKTIKTYQSAASLEARQHDDWDPEWIHGVFFGLLKCTNTKCEETVIVTGDMHCNEDHEYDYFNDRYDMIVHEMLTPTCFNPPLHLFNINKDVSDIVRTEIINAFKIYWLDIFSCANKIRVVVELIMDEMKVAKTYMQSGKRKGYSLHKRIELFKTTNPAEADLLMAIKWIGNTGSHSGDALTKDDILDGFEILENVTAKLYDTEADRIKKLSKTINKRRKPMGKVRAKRKR